MDSDRVNDGKLDTEAIGIGLAQCNLQTGLKRIAVDLLENPRKKWIIGNAVILVIVTAIPSI